MHWSTKTVRMSVIEGERRGGLFTHRIAQTSHHDYSLVIQVLSKLEKLILKLTKEMVWANLQ